MKSLAPRRCVWQAEIHLYWLWFLCTCSQAVSVNTFVCGIMNYVRGKQVASTLICSPAHIFLSRLCICVALCWHSCSRHAANSGTKAAAAERTTSSRAWKLWLKTKWSPAQAKWTNWLVFCHFLPDDLTPGEFHFLILKCRCHHVVKPPVGGFQMLGCTRPSYDSLHWVAP